MHRNELLGLANVVSHGIGRRPDGRKAVIVGVTRKLPLTALADEDVVPDECDGLPTDVVEMGVIRAYANTGRNRPALGGDSVGHFAITAGTLSCVAKQRSDGRRVILSNNHVLANSNDAELGDPILQPGAHDGGTQPADTIAELTAFEPIRFVGLDPSECLPARAIAAVLNGIARVFGRQTRLQPVRSASSTANLIDAAIATPIRDTDVSDEIRDIGLPLGLGEAAVGAVVIKSGRTTGFTSGTVTQVNATVQVQFGLGRIATFEDQIISDIPSQPGDSGSAILHASGHLVGLLFAGSDTVTIANRAANVFSALDLTL